MKRTAMPLTLLLTASIRNTTPHFDAPRHALASALTMPKNPNDTLPYIPTDPNVNPGGDSAHILDSLPGTRNAVATILQAGLTLPMTRHTHQLSGTHHSSDEHDPPSEPGHHATTTHSSHLPERATDEKIATQILHTRIQEGVRRSITGLVVLQGFKEKTLEKDMIELITQLISLHRTTDSTYTIHLNTNDTATLSAVFTNYPKLTKLFRNTGIAGLITKALSSIFQHMQSGNFDYEDKTMQRPKFGVTHKSVDDIYASLQAYAQDFSKAGKNPNKTPFSSKNH